MDNHAVRNAIIATLPADTSYGGQAPPAKFLYVPRTHFKALQPECQLVVGTRGVGKTFWLRTLADEGLREFLDSEVPQLDKTKISIGFSEKPSRAHPTGETFEALLKEGHSPYDIWRSIVIRWAAGLIERGIPADSWSVSVQWVADNPEAVNDMMLSASEVLTDKDDYGLILFDALDRLSSDWGVMDKIVRGLLRTALWLKPYERLATKVFLREDQLERTVTDFPDASKLLATKAELSWARHDLHGLLWQYLLNGEGENGACLRRVYEQVVGGKPDEHDGIFSPAAAARRESDAQKALFRALAGPWMGRDRRRGVPYTWTVGHLADGQGRTSPRSFLAAIRQAAEDTRDNYPGHREVLHYESIKRGVQEASEIRVNELAEDYPWIRDFLIPLKGVSVPIEFGEIRNRWKQEYPQGPGRTAAHGSLPPQRLEEGWTGISEDLLRLGVFEQRKDRRIDMPDLYRVGFGLGRRGGVKPKNR